MLLHLHTADVHGPFIALSNLILIHGSAEMASGNMWAKCTYERIASHIFTGRLSFVLRGTFEWLHGRLNKLALHLCDHGEIVI